MATLKQIEANRRNALKSTGPRTPEGKAAVSLNALKHGLRARRVVLPGENLEQFHQLCDDLEAEWRPQSRTEQFYVEQMAVSQWKLTRMETAEHGVYSKDPEVSALDRIWTAQHRMERAYARAQREVERLQKSRRPKNLAQAATTEEEAEVGQPFSPVDSAAAGEAPSASAGAPAPAATPEENPAHPTSEHNALDTSDPNLYNRLNTVFPSERSRELTNEKDSAESISAGGRSLDERDSLRSGGACSGPLRVGDR